MKWHLSLPLTLRVPLIAAAMMGLMGIVASQLVLSSLIRSQERQLADLARSEFATLSSTLAPLIQREDIWEMFAALERATKRTAGLAPIRASLVDGRGQVIVSSEPELYPVGAIGIGLIESASPLDLLSYDDAQEVFSVRQVVGKLPVRTV